MIGKIFMFVSSVREQKGSTILTVLFATLVVCFLGGVAMDFALRSKRQEIVGAQRQELFSLVRSLSLQLNDGVLCPKLLGGQILNQTLFNDEQPIRINTSYNNTSGPIAAGWSYSPNYLALRSVAIRLLNPTKQIYFGSSIDRSVRLATDPNWPAPWIGSIPNDEKVLTKFTAEVVLTPNDPNIFWNTKNNPDTVIPIFLKLTSTGRISQCHGGLSTAEACEASGGAFDGKFAPPQFRCNPNFYCFKDQQQVSNTPTCTPPYKPEIMSYLGTGYFYFCSWCNP
jgi:hypothetical protein